MHLQDYKNKPLTKEIVLSDDQLMGDIIGSAQNDFLISYTFMSKKLALRREWYKEYTKPDVHRDMIIKIHYARQQIEAFKATFFENGLQAKFSARELGDDELGYRLEKLAEYDQEAMKKNQKDYRLLDFIGFYGVGIEVKKGYDKVSKLPLYEVVSPETRLPDIYGDVINDNREYHMFIQRTTRHRMDTVNNSNPGTYFNLDQITTSSLFEYDRNEYIKKTTRLLNTYEDFQRVLKTTLYYKILNGRKYLIELANYNSLLIRFEEIEPITKEEKENPALVPFPVNIANMCPIEGDPTGIGIVELTLDKQGALNRLMNSALMVEQRNAGFTNYLVDTNVVQNLDLLAKKPLNGPSFIPAKTVNGAPVSSAIFPINEMPVDGNAISILDKVDLIGQVETGFTNQARGVSGQQAETLGESKQLQINANSLFGLTSQVLSRFVYRFWKNIRYRTLIENMADSDYKEQLVTHGLGTTRIKVTRKDLLSGVNKRLRIENRKDKVEKDKQLLMYMQAMYPLIAQDPTTPQISKNIFKRKMNELGGMSREMVYVTTPLSPDEIRAIDYVGMINEDIMPKSLFTPGMDYQTYRIYLNQCEPTKTKDKVLMILRKEMIKEGQQPAQQMQPQMGGVANSMASQSNSSFIQQGQQPNLPTMQDVKGQQA